MSPADFEDAPPAEASLRHPLSRFPCDLTQNAANYSLGCACLTATGPLPSVDLPLSTTGLCDCGPSRFVGFYLRERLDSWIDELKNYCAQHSAKAGFQRLGLLRRQIFDGFGKCNIQCSHRLDSAVSDCSCALKRI